MSDRARRIAHVHAAARDLGLDPETRRDLQLSVVGKASTADMDAGEIDRVIAALKARGWTPKAGRGRRRRPAARHAHQRKVYAVWGELKRRGIWRADGVESLDAFCARVAGVAAPDWLTPGQANKVIEALKKIAAREGVEIA